MQAVHNCQNLEVTKRTSRWLDKQTVVHSFKEVSLSDKRKSMIKQQKDKEKS